MKLSADREAWRTKPLLRRLYREYVRRIQDFLPNPADRVIEMGGGSGNLREFLPHAISTDIVRCPWLDAVLDAHTLPFRSGEIDAFVGLDVLHHLAYPIRFFSEASRCLRPGGRILLVDPYISLASRIVFALLHPEPVDFSADFFDEPPQPVPSCKDPREGNQAMATALFWRQRWRFEERFPSLRILACEPVGWVWPLTGGFSYPALIPDRWGEGFSRLARWRFGNRMGAFHAFVVIENAG
jgi:SAM-dependent methyltransferase